MIRDNTVCALIHSIDAYCSKCYFYSFLLSTSLFRFEWPIGKQIKCRVYDMISGLVRTAFYHMIVFNLIT